MFVQSIEDLHVRLKAYIEAVYHVADTRILDQRSALLERDGVIRQPAFIESTRQYSTGERYESLLAEAPFELRALATALSSPPSPLLYDPPYAHQGEALRMLLFDRRDIVVFTGTGSGKTECFTIPILMRLLREAVAVRRSFERRAMRAIVLYPMNALVNDQLGRMRRLFNHVDVVNAFVKASGRPATFGQYTGRTPFPGLRKFTADTDGRRMASFEKFYIDTVLDPAEASPPNADALLLLRALTDRGRWPAKHDLKKWFGNGLWNKRLHPQSEDRELVARHEFYGYTAQDGTHYGAPPDILITNYSMLEYMLMRPIERSLFDRTRAWLDEHREQDLYLVLDEAHLYRGAQGTEVALLIRRLRERLGLASPDREHQLRISVTSASFSASDEARHFAADLVGRARSSFVAIGGSVAFEDAGEPGGEALARELQRADLARFYSAADLVSRFEAIRRVLERFRGSAIVDLPSDEAGLARAVYDALVNHPVRRRVVSLTQQQALQIPELSEQLFPGVSPDVARSATEVLASLCAFAKPTPGASNLLPSRIHTFHRGLPGLWACVNSHCVGAANGPGPIGALFGQPRDTCDHCGSRVFEFLTCRSCGAAYLRAACAASEIDAPRFLWGQAVTLGTLPPVVALDVLVEAARADTSLAQQVWLDTRTGAILPDAGDGVRSVGLYVVDPARDEPVAKEGRRFFRCGVCGDDNNIKRDAKITHRSPVEDHQTEGQDPFYALVHEQLMRQPPRPTRPAFLKKETPLAGRKVLIFSDGRQKAARLAAELGRAALRDSLRPLVLAGYREAPRLALRHMYAALLIGAGARDVELRATDERFDDELRRHVTLAREVIEAGFEEDSLVELRECAAPPPVATLLLRVLRDKHTGLQALALARIIPLGSKTKKRLDALPKIPGLSQVDTQALIKLWLGTFVESYGCTAFDVDSLEDDFRWLAADSASGALKGILRVVATYSADAQRFFHEEWLPGARDAFRSDADDEGAKTISLNANRLTLEVCDDDALPTWGRCDKCSRVQGAVLGGTCVHCQTNSTVQPLMPDSDAEKRFLSRKRFYRTTAMDDAGALVRPLVAREHSAALTGVSGDSQSRAERHELAFQDITAPTIDGMRSPIDVLSCTTTMEVGIDIGDLSAVALRNMPPGRANYQQRAGRAGRRGNAVATVLAYADQDGHNQHFFENPRKLIKAAVPDPTLNLENPRIAQRHINAFVLQAFLVEVVPSTEAPDPRTANLFATLGTVEEFLSGSTPLNLEALRLWLSDEEKVRQVRAAIERWLPLQVRERADLVASFPGNLIESIERGLNVKVATEGEAVEAVESAQQEDLDAEDAPTKPRSLLDRLLYVGTLPKYAFPTDLVAFHVFESTFGLNAKPSEARRSLRYAPQRALSLALSEYAPGRTVFIDGRLWISTGLYSPMPGALVSAFTDEKYFRACTVCGYASLGVDGVPTKQPCPSCGDAKLGESVGTKWIRPPGFVHAVNLKPRTDPNLAQFSRPGRAVLWTPSPPKEEWNAAGGGVGWHLGLGEEWEVIITNRGPRDQGFRVCRSCGAVEPATEGRLTGGKHHAPIPNSGGFTFDCDTPAMDTVSLGTRFRTDVLLLRFQLPDGQSVAPWLPTGVFQMALSSLATALSLAASLTLEIEAGEVIAGYRSSFTMDGPSKNAVEVFLYDQLAGGAGYVVELSSRIEELMAATRAILRHEPWEGRTPQPSCDRACYGCLLSFKNSFEHPFLDRRLALDLLEASLSGVAATLGEERTKTALGMIERWLDLLKPGEVVRDVPVDEEGTRIPLAVRRRDGVLVVPALCHPFSSTTPDDPQLRDRLLAGMGSSADVALLDQLVVARALPIAMEELRSKLGE